MSNTTTSTAIQIISRHATVSEAVAAANIDLSYNEELAKRSLRDLERGFTFKGQLAKSGEAFVTTDGVYYVYNCDIQIMHKYEPFHSMLDDSKFAAVVIGDNEIQFSDRIIPKTKESRKLIAQIGMMVG